MQRSKLAMAFVVMLLMAWAPALGGGCGPYQEGGAWCSSVCTFTQGGMYCWPNQDYPTHCCWESGTGHTCGEASRCEDCECESGGGGGF